MISDLLFGYLQTQCLYVAAKLNIADHLEFSSKNARELAYLTDSDEESLYRVLRCLTSLTIFKEDENHFFSLNHEANDLLSNSETTWKDFIILCGEELYQAAGNLLYSVKTGKPAFNHIFGTSHWEYLEKHPDKAELFHNAMEKGTNSLLKELISHYNFSPFKNIIDVGGGKGHLLCEILTQYTNATGIVFDLKNAQHSADQYIKDRITSDRCKFVSGNFFISIPNNFDLYLLKVVLHDWDDESVVRILENCHKSMHHKSKLLIIEKIIDENEFKNLTCLGDINMLVTLTGKERSLLEFKKLLAKSGFQFIQKKDTDSVFSIIEAKPL